MQISVLIVYFPEFDEHLGNKVSIIYLRDLNEISTLRGR